MKLNVLYIYFRKRIWMRFGDSKYFGAILISGGGTLGTVNLLGFVENVGFKNK